MTWVVTVHGCGGSMAEAVDVEYAFSVRDEATAKGMADGLQNALNTTDPYGEWLVQHFEVLPAGRYDWPKPSAADLQALVAHQGPIPADRQAVDMRQVAKKIIEHGEWLDLLPEPVSKDDEDAAIASILGQS